MDEKILDRYNKVKALSEDVGTSPGERATARRTLDRMEEAHEGIARAAAERQKKAQPKVDPPASSVPKSSGLPGNWENIFRYAAGFAETVREVVTEVAEVQYGADLAEELVELQGKTRRDAVHLTIKLPHEALMEAQELSDIQKQAFKQAIHNMLGAYLDAILDDNEED